MKKMKIFTLALMIILGMSLFAQDAEIEKDISVDEQEEYQDAQQEVQEAMEDVQEEIQEAMEDAQEALNEANINITLPNTPTETNRPKMGVFLENLDFQSAYEMHYDYNYGVLLSGVVRGGNAYKAGLMKGDIIMAFDGTKVRHEEHLTRLIRKQAVGNTVTIKYFRDEQTYETTLTFAAPKEEKTAEGMITEKFKTRKRISVGYGGGSWIPVWYNPDVEELNVALANLGFADEVIPEDGILLQGGGGKGNVGHGWFIGGMGVGYKNNKTTKVDWTLDDGTIIPDVSRKLTYGMNYWGVTLDKRYAISKKFVTSLGFALGGGKEWLKVKQNADNGNIPNFDFNDPQFGTNYDYTSTLKMKQTFVIFQPKAMVMYHFLDWLGLRLEAGYVASYAPYGLKVTQNGEKVDFVNEPDIDMNGFTVSIGPWFGF